MRKLLVVLLLLPCTKSFAQTPQQIENQRAFTKLYGYVKYFYPGDEAAKINWDKFAIYGAEKVDACKNPSELKDSLQSMIYPLMPGIKITGTSESTAFDKQLLTPVKLTNYKIISWQHFGVGTQKDPRSLYASARTNRPRVFERQQTAGPISASIDASGLEGQNFVFSGKAKMVSGSGNGHLWLRVDKKNKEYGFFNNMDQNPITSKEWANFTIKGKIDKGAVKVAFGAFLFDTGAFVFDDLTLKVEQNGKYEEVYNNDFSKEELNKAPASLKIGIGMGTTSSSPYSFMVLEDNGNRYVEIKSPLIKTADTKEHSTLFEATPKFGEFIEKDLGQGLKALIPIALYGTEVNTFPIADTAVVTKYVTQINNLPSNSLTADHLYTRIGNIGNAWNVFQHFYPYFDEVKTDWHQDLSTALQEAYRDKNAADFSRTLKKLTAKLKDGHITVGFRNPDSYLPPIAWKWVENQLVITSLLADSIPLTAGTVVTKINGKDPKVYFADVKQYISAATKGWLDYRAQTESLLGAKDAKMILSLQNSDNQTKTVEVTHSLTSQEHSALLPKQDTLKALSPGITYLSISNVSMKIIDAALPQLKKSKAIICDLRGWPANNTGLINYLLTVQDTSGRWMQIPKIIYPDQENISGYQYERWPLKPDKTHLKAKIFFLIDGRAISYAESYMSFIEYYKLATIIGEPTAGTNGNVNQFNLPGNFTVKFTGMKVYKHDGSQFHGIGIKPNIYVEQTIKGIRENRDEILERAILEASKQD